MIRVLKKGEKKKMHLFLSLLKVAFRKVISNKRKTVLKMDDCFAEFFVQSASLQHVGFNIFVFWLTDLTRRCENFSSKKV